MGEATNIYPIYEKMMTRSDKEQLLGQRGVMVWFTGLSGSGKSTVAQDTTLMQLPFYTECHRTFPGTG